MPRWVANILVLLALFLASIATVHIAFFWFGSWFHPASAWRVWTVVLGVLLFAGVCLWYWLDPQRSAILAAAVVVVAIELGAIIFASGWDFTRLSYTQGFDVEWAMMFFPVGAYVLTKLIASRRQRRIALRGRERKPHPRSASPAQDEHPAEPPPR